MSALVEWFVEFAPWIAFGSGLLSVALLIASVVLVPRGLAAMPVDWLLHEPPPPPLRERIGRNVVGWTLILLGIAMLVLPGQGLLTLVIGLVLADVPGKRRMVHALVAVRPVRAGVDALRRRAGVEPLLHPGE